MSRDVVALVVILAYGMLAFGWGIVIGYVLTAR